MRTIDTIKRRLIRIAALGMSWSSLMRNIMRLGPHLSYVIVDGEKMPWDKFKGDPRVPHGQILIGIIGKIQEKLKVFQQTKASYQVFIKKLEENLNELRQQSQILQENILEKVSEGLPWSIAMYQDYIEADKGEVLLTGIKQAIQQFASDDKYSETVSSLTDFIHNFTGTFNVAKKSDPEQIKKFWDTIPEEHRNRITQIAFETSEHFRGIEEGKGREKVETILDHKKGQDYVATGGRAFVEDIVKSLLSTITRNLSSIYVESMSEPLKKVMETEKQNIREPLTEAAEVVWSIIEEYDVMQNQKETELERWKSK